jgi:hypothetical protein
MSISALTTLAAAREERAPTKGDVSKAKHGTSKAGEAASTQDVLAAQVPTELVAPYTAITAAIVGLVTKPSAKNPHPDQLATWRWAAFALLVVGIIGFVYSGKRSKSAPENQAFPALAVTGALVSGVGWAFALPGGPLTPYLHSKAALTLTPILIAFAAIIAATLTAGNLKNPKSP